ncbi:MAG: thiamine pyrophosphate-binding protein [Acidobacteriaceae bacterium]|nr:thiamine pyrophosphate-binding protein [Acidobacteriaceae bacterium]
MAENANGAAAFLGTLKRLGIDRMFTLVGDHLNEVLSQSEGAGIEVIHMRHEAAVVHAADAWARCTRRPALSLVTGGPGHTNSLTGLITANSNGTPLITVSGAPAQLMRHRVVFQDLDQAAMAAPAAKWTHTVTSAAQIPFALGKAYSEASTGRMGVAHLTIPVDCFRGAANGAPRVPQATPVGGTPDVAPLLQLLKGAKRPVVIGGSGLWWADAGLALREFLERSRLPYYDVTMARGLAPSLGYADPSLNRACVEVFRQADVVVVLGKRIDYRLAMGGPRLFSAEAKFAQVDIHGPELGLNRELAVGLCADVRAVLTALNGKLGKWTAPGWVPASTWAADMDALAAAHAGDKVMHPASFYAELRRTLPVDPLLSWDGGDFVHWGRAMLPANHPGGWLRLGPMATIGAALPNAIALQMHRPKQPVMMVTGDGSFGFYLAELDTAVRYKLPLVIVVGNDGGWGLERELQGELLGSTVACELRRTRYDQIAKGFGCGGENITKLSQVGPALERAFRSQAPYVLNVNVQGARSPFTQWQLDGRGK